MNDSKRAGALGMVKRLLLLALVLGLAVGAYGLQRGLRYPPLQFDPQPQPVEVALEVATIRAEGAYVIDETMRPPRLRACAPEPVVTIEWKSVPEEPLRLMLENLHPEARIHGAQDLGSGKLDRFFDVPPPPAGGESVVRVEFPQRETYRFLAFGDAGGGPELDHCFRRAAELGVDFIVHLGDIGYEVNDLELGITAFGAAPVPVYVACGNHDFHGGHRYRFRIFKQYYGPLNSYFTLGGVEFLNLDTAADTVPASGGRRGEMLERVRAARAGSNVPLLVFTHRPLEDPRTFDAPEADPHALNRAAEAEWLREQIKELGAVALLAGHIHESHDYEHEGLRTLIAGEGLGNRTPEPKLLVGSYAPGGPIEFEWVPR